MSPMTERVSNSLAVSALAHAAVVVVAGLLVSLAPISKIEILPTTTPTFVLVAPEVASQLNSSPDKSGNPAATVSLPPIPKPVISRPPPEIVLDTTPRPSPSGKPTPETQAHTRTPAAVSRPQMSFKNFEAAHTKSPASTGRPVTRIAAPSFTEAILDAQAIGSSARKNSEDDAATRSFNAELIQKLHTAYQPTGMEDSSFFCRIEFVLGAQGHVASSRILMSSGNRIFDNAVLEALSRVRVSTPPSALVGTPLTTTFQVKQ